MKSEMVKHFKESFWVMLAVAGVLYTIFAIYCFTPWYHDPDEPQIYQMRLVERYDASYFSTGKSKQHVVRYKGVFVENETGKRSDLVINEYMFFKMPIGETVPMSFKPSYFGANTDESLTHKLLPTFWFLVWGSMAISFGFIWLLFKE